MSGCLTCEDLAASEAMLLERVASLESDVAAYREMVQLSVETVARLTAQLDTARHTINALRAAERAAAPAQRAA
jgi:phage shock protein A